MFEKHYTVIHYKRVQLENVEMPVVKDIYVVSLLTTTTFTAMPVGGLQGQCSDQPLVSPSLIPMHALPQMGFQDGPSPASHYAYASNIMGHPQVCLSF